MSTDLCISSMLRLNPRFFLHPPSPFVNIQGADILVTGTLGLAAPQTKKAMFRAAELVKSGGGKLLVDVNWRPVFWDDLEVARKEILAFLDMADIVKISDADLEYLYDMQSVTALLNPCAVSEWGLLCVFSGCAYDFNCLMPYDSLACG